MGGYIEEEENGLGTFFSSSLRLPSGVGPVPSSPPSPFTFMKEAWASLTTVPKGGSWISGRRACRLWVGEWVGGWVGAWIECGGLVNGGRREPRREGDY